MSEITSKKRKLSLPLVLAGGVSSLVLALGMSPTFSAFTASIVNNANNAATGTLTMQESTVGGTVVTCESGLGTADCSTNKYGGSTTMVPGTPVVTNITIKNTGTVAASSFTLGFGACTNTPTDAADLCSKMLVEVKSGSTVITPVNSTAKNLSELTPIDIRTKLPGSLPIAGGSSAIQFTITVTMPSSTPDVDNAYQGTQISQAMTWTFQS